ncbi:MAG: SOS response-associated peptidase [Alphaproteobacteria bacterium]|nr:SOS response-associated peptidase [Alphaproteobacteria bacterium]
MCGLYSFRKSAEETRSLFDYLDTPDFPPRTYVAPGGPIAIVRMEQGQRRFALVRWGFIPSWVKELKPGKPLINARGETVAEKPSFRHAFRRRRCLIPADGFYEWLGDVPGKKIPYFIHRADDGLFAFAGLWEHWMSPDGSEIETGVIVTTAPNREVAEIHDRMPVVIQPQDYETWLTGEADAAAKLIHPAPDGLFTLEPTRIERNAPPPRAKVEKASPQMKLL